jgi:hypothetical protein
MSALCLCLMLVCSSATAQVPVVTAVQQITAAKDAYTKAKNHYDTARGKLAAVESIIDARVYTPQVALDLLDAAQDNILDAMQNLDSADSYIDDAIEAFDAYNYPLVKTYTDASKNESNHCETKCSAAETKLSQILTILSQ